LESADGFVLPAGNNPCHVKVSGIDTPRGLSPYRAWHWEYAVTREIRATVRWRRAPANKC